MQPIGKFRRTLLVSLVLSAVSGAPSFARSTDDAFLASIGPGQSARLILQFATTAERDGAFNRLLDLGLAVRAVDTEGGPGLVAFGSAAAFGGELSRASRVSLDAGVQVLASQPARDTSARMRLSRSKAPPPHRNASRRGIAVAIIDSGFAPHADLPASRIRAYRDFVTGSTIPVDGCGHGTHVAGIIAGSGSHSDGAYAGIAPEVDIVRPASARR